MKTIHRTIVSALIFSRDGKLLMGMKDPTSGGVEEGETQEQALHRELLEEVGIDTSNCTVTLADNQGTGETEKILKETGERVLCKMQFNVYRVEINKDAKDVAARAGDDLVQLEWVGLDQLNNYKMTPPSVGLFERLGCLDRKLS